MHGWKNLSEGDVQPVTDLRGTWQHYTGFRPLGVRRVAGGAVLAGMLQPNGPGTISEGIDMFRVPSYFRPAYSTTIEAVTGVGRDGRFRIGADGWVKKVGTESNSMPWLEFNTFYTHNKKDHSWNLILLT